MAQSRRETVDPALSARGLGLGEGAGLGRVVLGHFGGAGRGRVVRRVVGVVLATVVGAPLALFVAAGVFVDSVPLPVKGFLVLFDLLYLWGVVSMVRGLLGPRRWWVGLFDDGIVITHDRPRHDLAVKWVDVDQVSFGPALRRDGQGSAVLAGERLVLRLAGRRRPYVLDDLTNDLATLGSRAVQLHNAHCLPG